MGVSLNGGTPHHLRKPPYHLEFHSQKPGFDVDQCCWCAIYRETCSPIRSIENLGALNRVAPGEENDGR